MRDWSLTIARVWGIPIRLHVTLILALPFLALAYSPFMAIGLFVSIVLHELGHSLVALRKGCRVREILLLPIGGAAQMERMPARPRDELLLAIAGPLVSAALFAALFFGGRYVPLANLIPGSGLYLNRLQVLGLVNAGLTLFNLLPSFPMDGGRILRALLAPRLGRLRATRIAARVGQVIAVLFVLYALHDVRHHFMLVIVGLFVFWTAGAEYRLVQLQEELKRHFERFAAGQPGYPPPATGDRAWVSPPPYRPGPAQETPLRVHRENNEVVPDDE
jgi:Zn-dependent protease